MDQSTLSNLADRHLAMQTHHLALAEHHESRGDTEIAGLHRSMAAHSLHVAKGFGELAASMPEAAGASPAAQPAQATPASPMSTAKQPMPAGTDRMAIGAATQLLRKGHITKRHHARIVKKAFGSLSGAGHYQGDVDQTDSPGTNAGM